MKSILFAISVAVFFFLSPNTWGGGPFFVDSGGNGHSLTWPNNKVKFYTDGDSLNDQIIEEDAAEWINQLFAIWQNAKLETTTGRKIRVVDFQYEYGGSVGYDINVDNYVGAVMGLYGNAVVIFDSDGKIIDRELGESAHEYVVGFASPLSTGGPYFVGGIIVLNGLFVDGDDKNSREIPINQFKSALLHEMGHLLNLDHTQANIELISRIESGDMLMIEDVPTMYPVLYGEEQMTPHTDDIVALAEQYPSENYKTEFCKINGELTGIDGEGFQGADVVARATDPAFEYSDVRTYISGVLYPAGAKNGEYHLSGLTPEREYKITYRGVDPFFNGG